MMKSHNHVMSLNGYSFIEFPAISPHPPKIIKTRLWVVPRESPIADDTHHCISQADHARNFADKPTTKRCLQFPTIDTAAVKHTNCSFLQNGNINNNKYNNGIQGKSSKNNKGHQGKKRTKSLLKTDQVVRQNCERNQRERLRVRKINEAFLVLSSCLPDYYQPQQKRKMKQCETIESAIDYINILKSQLLD